MKDEEEIIDGGNESCNFHDMEDDTSADSSNFESKTADKAVQVLIPDTIPKVKHVQGEYKQESRLLTLKQPILKFNVTRLASVVNAIKI